MPLTRKGELKKAKSLALKLRVMWKAIERSRTCWCEECLLSSVRPLREFAEDAGFREFGEGLLKYVFLGKHWVIKIPRSTPYVVGTRHEAFRFIHWKDNPELSHHLPKTYFLPDGFMVQERVQLISGDDYVRIRPTLDRLSTEFDITDLHEWNVGWKDNTFILFDCPSFKLQDRLFSEYMRLHSEGRARHHKEKRP